MLAVACAQAGLERLAFQNVGCSIHACAALDELLQSTGSLQQLHLHNNMSADEGAASIATILARSPAMRDFKMASSRVGPAGGKALADALSKGASLCRVCLLCQHPAQQSDITAIWHTDLATLIQSRLFSKVEVSVMGRRL